MSETTFTDLQRETMQEMFQFAMGGSFLAEFISMDTIPNGQRFLFSVHTDDKRMDRTILYFTRKFIGKADAAGLEFKRKGFEIHVWVVNPA